MESEEPTTEETPELLVYLTKTEVLVVTRMRESTTEGKQLILNAAQAASKKPKATPIKLLD